MIPAEGSAMLATRMKSVSLLLLLTGPLAADPPPVPRLAQYGDPLPDGAIARLGTVRMRHGYLISGLAFSGDGKAIFASDYYSGVHVWDTATGTELRRFFEKDSYCHALAISPDGKTLAVALGDLSIRLCDPDTGREVGKLPKLVNRPSYMVFSADSSLLATGVGKSVSVWDVAARRKVREVPFSEYVGHVSFSADGTVLAAGTSDGVRLWDLEHGSLLHHLPNKPHTRHSLYAEFAPRGGPLAVWGYDDASVRLFDPTGEKELRRLNPTRLVRTRDTDNWGWTTSLFVSFAPDGKTVAVAREVGRIEVWDVESGKKLRTLGGDASRRASMMVFSPEGTKLATAGSDNWGGDHAVRVWDVAAGKELNPRHGHAAPVTSIAVSPDSKTIATAGRDGVVHLWEATTGKHLHRLEGYPGWRPQVSFSADGRQVLSWEGYNGDGVLRMWDAATGRVAGRLELKGPDQFWDTVSDDGKTAVSVDFKEKTTKFHDIATGRVLRTIADGAYHAPQALSPTGKDMVCSDGHLRTAVDLRERFKVGRFGYPNPTARFSADGRRLVAAVISLAEGKDFRSDPPADEVVVVDPIAGKELRRFAKWDEKFNPLDAAGLSRDGKTVVTIRASDRQPGEQVVTLWETETGRERGHFLGHRGTGHALAVSPDGRFVVTGGDDTTALVWDATHPWTHDPVAHRDSPAAWFKDLARDDGERAYAAFWGLVRTPKESVAFLAEEPSLYSTTPAEKIERWIADLDANKFADRERASRDLASILDEAEPHLNAALRKNPSPEARGRIELLLHARNQGPTGREVLKFRVIETLERIGTPAAVGVLKKLAAGLPDALPTQDAQATLERMRGLLDR
jgi:WD40 repeat protein